MGLKLKEVRIGKARKIMTIREIVEELEENLKPNIWAYVEDENTDLQKKIKDTTNLLLDLLESLESEDTNEA